MPTAPAGNSARLRDVTFAVAAGLVLVASIVGSRLGTTPPRPAPSHAQADVPSAQTRRTLPVVPNPDPNAAKEPGRCRPSRVAVSTDGTRAFVALTGKESAPGSEVVVLDVARRVEVGRIQVGHHPFGMALHPNGRWLLVVNRTSNFLSVIDVAAARGVGEIPVPFYCEDLVFAPDGRTAFVTNFWLDQVLVVDLTPGDTALAGRLRDLGWGGSAWTAPSETASASDRVCARCGRAAREESRCQKCGGTEWRELPAAVRRPSADPIRALVRARCGTVGCHQQAAGGFYAGADDAELRRRVLAHVVPGAPAASVLLRSVLARADGGWADAIDGRHHPGGVVFPHGRQDPDVVTLTDWIATVREGPGISVGDKPRDLAVSPDGRTLLVANTGSLDVSVIDVETLRESHRIFTRSPVNDIAWVQQRALFATLGVGSGHPKAHDTNRESLDRANPGADFTLRRDFATGQPLPLAQQDPMGPFDEVDGTAQEKFRDITNDLVLLDPRVADVAAYRADEGFTRMTSDSFETLPGDKKGDVPAELLRVVGAFPEQIAARGDRCFVTMSGTFQVQEWRIDAAAPPAARLEPLRVFDTGFKPVGIAVAGDTLVVANLLGESVSFIDLASGASAALSLSRLPAPFPSTDFERGELLVQTSVFSIDQDQSCVHCHYRDASDGKAWSVSQVMGQSREGAERTGGSREVPDMRALFHKVPFFVEGTLTMDEPLTMMMEQNPLLDFQGRTPVGDFSDVFAAPEEEAGYARSADLLVTAGRPGAAATGARFVDLAKRRDLHVRRLTERYLGHAYSFRELQQFIGAYQGLESRLSPNPESPDDPMVRNGQAIFEDPRVGCSECHRKPGFTDKIHPRNINRSFPPVVSPAPRDNVHTLVSADRLDAILGYVRPWDPEDRGRVEEREGQFVVPSLRGLWLRPDRFLHHGHAVTLREIVCTPDHAALRPFPFERRDVPRPGQLERGLNERDSLPDTHGTTSHLSVWDIECLLRYVNAIE